MALQLCLIHIKNKYRQDIRRQPKSNLTRHTTSLHNASSANSISKKQQPILVEFEVNQAN